MTDNKIELINTDSDGYVIPGEDWHKFPTRENAFGGYWPTTYRGWGVFIGDLALREKMDDIPNRIISAFAEAAEPPIDGEDLSHFSEGVIIASLVKRHHRDTGIV
ncbi:MAG: hypothetical protein QFB86_00650 [Patescibacteria group bacterium]|nr:hypothetical protein [Patescibacteria group bacterium]